MSYVSGFVAAVPTARKEEYLRFSTLMASVFRDHGATRVVETWEADVPDGTLTDFRRAVKAEPGEAIVFSWIEYPSREVADRSFETAMQDPRTPKDMPFDGKRMIFGGFSKILEV